ncbi:DUF6167 family protein [Nocardioides sambongensis]|uniref:DUF6167 family protein n=1 Tax=Nocardioides sambongensis TaxID=2589074 RepID=UPI00112ABD70|nr:DUF6167 family protein [Nocardioides sambongensis]
MSRGLWFGAGIAAGVYGMVRARRAAEVLTVDGLRDRVGAVFVGARMFREELDQGRVEAEHDLRERYRRATEHLGPPALNAADGTRRPLGVPTTGVPTTGVPTDAPEAPEKGTD